MTKLQAPKSKKAKATQVSFRLGELIKKEGVSVAEVAEKSGLSRNAIYELVNNKVSGISLSTLKKLNEAYGWGPEDVICIK